MIGRYEFGKARRRKGNIGAMLYIDYSNSLSVTKCNKVVAPPTQHRGREILYRIEI